MWVPEADGPLAECCKLADEIVKRMPDEESYPRPAASVPADILVIPACHEVREGSELSPQRRSGGFLRELGTPSRYTTSLRDLISDRGDVQIACIAFVRRLFLYFSAAASSRTSAACHVARRQTKKKPGVETGLPALSKNPDFRTSRRGRHGWHAGQRRS